MRIRTPVSEFFFSTAQCINQALQDNRDGANIKEDYREDDNSVMKLNGKYLCFVDCGAISGSSQMRPSRWFTMHGPAFTAVLLASLAITSLYLSTSNQNALTRISHTSQVQRAISKLSGSLTDVIVAERNFHLTGNKAYLADRLSTHKRAIDQFRVTSTLIDDNAKQTLLFAELRPLIDQRFATEQILIDTRLAGALARARIAPLALRAQAEMASVRSKIQEVEDVEAQLFDDERRGQRQRLGTEPSIWLRQAIRRTP